MRARFPQLKINRGTLSRICTRAKRTSELKELRALKEDHDTKAGLKGKEGKADDGSVLKEELSKLRTHLQLQLEDAKEATEELTKARTQLQVQEEETKRAQKQLKKAEQHVVVLQHMMSLKEAEASQLKFETNALRVQMRRERRKAATFGRQLDAANARNTELQQMLCEGAEDDEDTQETQGSEQTEG
ncbi:hypothetical protein PHYSODRAFT_247942 [Phytophthora sojae]|uniref:Uncharacterized protein n=1 Tax=Phytophthora sojae (strain P6497) TaxID=1094619 RepID=G4ZFW8_PHYSP|nr:hypothetical protein PHYSODRAFT_247942 [Phytophthora sojae]EGZ16652.1 hypothetical protein PHYSODRAFT_247942 [Phytophthora sojae]|eukprot:XP_009525710.1 hypothetical protein PHYSODRAFT_247942 [Phytophthora sojae]